LDGLLFGPRCLQDDPTQDILSTGFELVPKPSYKGETYQAGPCTYLRAVGSVVFLDGFAGTLIEHAQCQMIVLPCFARTIIAMLGTFSSRPRENAQIMIPSD
jgi:hypothetical protein